MTAPAPAAAAPPPLGVYLHWPYCQRICPYCDFNVVRDRGDRAGQAALAAAIAQDLAAQRGITGPRTLVSVFLGGGTPSLMDPAWAAELIATASRLWTPAPDLEVSLEANPTDAEAGRFAAFAQAGVARLSLGLQALDDGDLAFLGRLHDAAAGRRAAAAAARAFPRLSLDMIYALPGQTRAGWREALAEAVDLGAEHVSPYQLTLEAGTAFDRAVRRGRWTPADGDLAADLYEDTQAVLEARGFDAYEVSNHARGERARSRHNLVYWRGLDYVGAGPGAHGRLTARGVRRATVAHPRVGDYLEAVARTGTGFATTEALDPRALAEERLLMGLRTTEGVDLAETAAAGLSAGDPRLGDHQRAGLLRVEAGRLVATPAGRLVLDRLTAELAA